MEDFGDDEVGFEAAQALALGFFYQGEPLGIAENGAVQAGFDVVGEVGGRVDGPARGRGRGAGGVPAGLGAFYGYAGH